MRLVMFVRTSRCPEYRSSYLPFEENHAQKKCADLTTEIVFKLQGMLFIYFKSFENVFNYSYNITHLTYLILCLLILELLPFFPYLKYGLL